MPKTTMKRFLIIILTMTWAAPTQGLPRTAFDPKENVWVSLARKLNTTTFCESLASPSTPSVTYLVGVPFIDYSSCGVIRFKLCYH